MLSLEFEEVIKFLFWSKNPFHCQGFSSVNSMKINPWKFIRFFFFFCKLILWKHNLTVQIRPCPSQMSAESEVMNKPSHLIFSTKVFQSQLRGHTQSLGKIVSTLEQASSSAETRSAERNSCGTLAPKEQWQGPHEGSQRCWRHRTGPVTRDTK